MINRRSVHGAVCMGNKLFVIGGKYNVTCEVFDSNSMRFSSIKQLNYKGFYYVSAVSFGGKILIVGAADSKGTERVCTYNLDNDKWYCTSYVSELEGAIVFISKLSVI